MQPPPSGAADCSGAEGTSGHIQKLDPMTNRLSPVASFLGLSPFLFGHGQYDYGHAANLQAHANGE